MSPIRAAACAARYGLAEAEGEQSKMERNLNNKKLWCNWCPIREVIG